jgi:hypothetical protein
LNPDPKELSKTFNVFKGNTYVIKDHKKCININIFMSKMPNPVGDPELDLDPD